MALCDRHVSAIARVRGEDPEARAQQRRAAESAAWQKLFGEPAPFG